MVLEKITQVFQSLKKSIIETFKLLWQFKWYVILYLLYISIYIFALIYFPEESHPIYKAEVTNNDWKYINQKVYIGSLKLELLNICLIFLLCDTEFIISKCNKLGKDWIYPAICYEKYK